MKKGKLFIGATALLCVLTMCFTACSKDDTVKDELLEITDMEIGKANSLQGVIGKDLHVECKIVATAKTKEIKVSIAQVGGDHKIEKNFNDVAGYIGVKNLTFHKHIALDSHLPEGKYHFTLTVVDGNNQSKSFSKDITLLKADPEAPVVEVVNPNKNDNKGFSGKKFLVKANITVKSPIKEIVVEFHGLKEYPVEVSDYNGKTGTIKFSKEVVIPEAAEEGDYHFHLEVTDSKDRTTVGEFEGFHIIKTK